MSTISCSHAELPQRNLGAAPPAAASRAARAVAFRRSGRRHASGRRDGSANERQRSVRETVAEPTLWNFMNTGKGTGSAEPFAAAATADSGARARTHVATSWPGRAARGDASRGGAPGAAHATARSSAADAFAPSPA